MRKKSICCAALALLFTLALSACSSKRGNDSPVKPTPDPTKQSIVFGGVRSQTGEYAMFDETGFGPIYRMWADEVNANGGIYVAEYDRKLPVELLIYDDGSSIPAMAKLYEKLIVEDRVDFLLPPVSTSYLYAAAPIANEHNYLLIGAEACGLTLKESAEKYPGLFLTLNFSETQIPAIREILLENHVSSAYIVFIEDLFGTEYVGAAIPEFEAVGIEIAGVKAISLSIDAPAMATIIANAEASGAESFFIFGYPDQNYLAIEQARAAGYNPSLFLTGPGGNFEISKEVIGEDAMNGVMSWGSWNEKSSNAAAEFAARFREIYADAPETSLDWWGHLPYYAGLEVLTQAIVRAGTLDNEVVTRIIEAERFATTMGVVWFDDGIISGSCYLGNVGQWQNGVFEIVDVGDNRTSAPIIPKPQWPD